MKSIYLHLIIPVISVILVLTGAIAGFSVHGIRTGIAPQFECMGMETLQARNDQISVWLEAKVTEVEYLADMLRDFDFDKIHGEAALTRLQDFLERNTNSFESMGYVTLEGEKHVTDGTVFSIVERPYFQKMLAENKRTVISDSIESRANGRNIILIVTKIVGRNGELKGYLSGAISLEYLHSVVNDAGLNGYPMYIVNGTDYSLIAGDYSEDETPFNDRLLHSQIKSNPDWYIALQIPETLIQKTIRQYITMVILFLTAASGISIWIVMKSARRMVKPIGEIQHHMEKTKHGCLEKSELKTDVLEIRSLTDSYNYMIDNILKLLADLKQEQVLKIEAENKALYSQIQPHFLYNTLETIQAIAYDHDDDEVEEAIGNLASLFRIGLSSGKQMIRLHDELLHVKSYLEIQKLRYGHLFTYQIDAKADTDILVLKFLLQPLVENAIYHGIKHGSRQGLILIQVREEKEHLLVEVKNTYETLDIKRLEHVNHMLREGHSPQDSYGLYNVNQRLRVNFRGNEGVKLSYDGQFVTASFYHPGKGGCDEYTGSR